MPVSHRRLCACLTAVLALACPAFGQSAKPPAKPGASAPAKVDPSDEFFAKGAIPQLRVKLTPEAERSLRNEPRKFTACVVVENETTSYEGCRVKLKGAAGSFRNYDDRPALTIKIGKGKPEFHGLEKFHLNNSVQDESYMSELLCSRLCGEAGLPAARATHARVWLNDRDMGLYGLKEGFDEEFLDRNFPAAKGKGNLYDGGFLQDIDAALERDEGEGADDKADLKALLAACREPDTARRWALIAERLDVDAFLNFVAMELMMCHWDGYARNKNNYRVYFRGDTKKAVFLPHGMDQMFGDTNFPVFDIPPTIVTAAVLQNPEWAGLYRKRVKEILPLFAPEKLHAKVDAAAQRVRAALTAMDANRARHVDGQIQGFKNRLNDRQKAIRAQLPPEPIVFAKQSWALIGDWEPASQGDAKLEKKEISGRPLLMIETGPSKTCDASFRAKVRLGKGTYRLEAKVRTVNVKAMTDNKGAGAGLRLGGVDRQNTNALIGTSEWRTLAYAFQVVEEARDVELIAELRGVAGGAVFDATSMKLVKVK
jgi:spore coat protein H